MQKSQHYPTSEGHWDAVQGKDLACGECFGVPQQIVERFTAASIARKVHPRGAGGVGMIPRQCIVERRDSHRFEMVFELVETET